MPTSYVCNLVANLSSNNTMIVCYLCVRVPTQDEGQKRRGRAVRDRSAYKASSYSPDHRKQAKLNADERDLRLPHHVQVNQREPPARYIDVSGIVVDTSVSPTQPQARAKTTDGRADGAHTIQDRKAGATAAR